MEHADHHERNRGLSRLVGCPEGAFSGRSYIGRCGGGARSDVPRVGCELDNVLVAHAFPVSGRRVVLCRLAVLTGSCHTADSAWFE